MVTIDSESYRESPKQKIEKVVMLWRDLVIADKKDRARRGTNRFRFPGEEKRRKISEIKFTLWLYLLITVQ